MTLTITPLGTYAGAEATGVDLSRPVDAETRQRLRAALVEHVALVVRGQKLDPDSFVTAVRASSRSQALTTGKPKGFRRRRPKLLRAR